MIDHYAFATDKNYQVVKATTMLDLENEVNRILNTNKYICLGGISVAYDGDRKKYIYCQALIRTKDPALKG